MPVKIRLARHGRKNSPYYHVVVADSRAPRDGRFIERIGSYNPTTNPATIELNIDRAIDWLRMGAQPTMTARRILSYKGVLLKQHLLEGVRKGAFDQEECERRFAAWMQEKEAKIESKRKSIAESKVAIKKNRLEAETKVNQARMETLRQKRAEEAAALEAKAKEAAAEAEENIEEAAEQ